jgi:gas vesicle protein
MKDQTRVIAALLIGAAAGAALGLLLAPEKGETLRDGIADYINDILDTAKEKAVAKGGDLYDKAKSKFNSAVSDLNEFKDEAIESARAKGQGLKNEAERRFNEGKAHVKNGSNEANEAIQKA